GRIGIGSLHFHFKIDHRPVESRHIPAFPEQGGGIILGIGSPKSFGNAFPDVFLPHIFSISTGIQGKLLLSIPDIQPRMTPVVMGSPLRQIFIAADDAYAAKYVRKIGDRILAKTLTGPVEL